MAQARLTDYFSQRRKAPAAGKKTSGKLGVSRRSCSAVRDDFLRLIDEASQGSDGGCLAGSPGTENLSPKRSSAAAKGDPGVPLLPGSEHQSPAKKSRTTGDREPGTTRDGEPDREPGNTEGRTVRRRARRKLEVSREDKEVKPLCPPSNRVKALSREDIASLKSRLQTIRKQTQEVTVNTSCPASKSTVQKESSTGPDSAPLVCPGPTPSSIPCPANSASPGSASSAEASVRVSVSRAKVLAAKALAANDAKESKEADQSEAPPSDSLPAYQRYHTLSQATPPGLALPYGYRLLAEMFRCFDAVVAMLVNRSETASFTKVQRGVQDMMHRSFHQSHAGQIQTVFPEAFVFRQQRIGSKGPYQLTLEPRRAPAGDSAHVLPPSLLLVRRRVFHRNLLAIVKRHHQAFLSSLTPPLEIPDDKLTRWHPTFNVDSVPPIESSALPQAPPTSKTATAQEVLERARNHLTPKMENALVSLALKTTEPAGSEEPASAVPGPKPAAAGSEPACPVAPVPTALKGVPASLLERVRAREANKLLAVLTRNPAQEERLLMMSRLGRLAPIVRGVFVAEKKAGLLMEVVCSRVASSYQSELSTAQVEKHLLLMAEVTSDWLTVHPIRKEVYLKLNRKLELSTVQDQLRLRLREEERLQGGPTPT